MDNLDLELVYRVLSVVLVATNIIEKVISMTRELRRRRTEGGDKHSIGAGGSRPVHYRAARDSLTQTGFAVSSV